MSLSLSVIKLLSRIWFSWYFVKVCLDHVISLFFCLDLSVVFRLFKTRCPFYKIYLHCRYLVVQVDLESLAAEVLLQVQVVALIVDLMAIGLEIVRLGTGRTSVTAVGSEVI